MNKLKRNRYAKTLDLCSKNYKYYPNVCGVSVGNKYIDGHEIVNSRVIQFFVSSKEDKEKLIKVLPKYVYERYINGKLNRNSKIQTDVIELANLKLCCSAGDRIEYVGGNGAATIVFQNKDRIDNNLYMLTCSHVVGDMLSSPGTNLEIIGGNQDCFFSATVLDNTTLNHGYVDYDIAICLVKNADNSFVDLSVSGNVVTLKNFIDVSQLNQGDILSCSFPISGTSSITVQSWKTSMSNIEIGTNKLIEIGNLVACRGVATSGDSGGIVYSGDSAVGILVAKADNDWVFFHPLVDAIDYLANMVQHSLVVFEPE